jgi:hypothetical protein
MLQSREQDKLDSKNHMKNSNIMIWWPIKKEWKQSLSFILNSSKYFSHFQRDIWKMHVLKVTCYVQWNQT